MVYSTGEGLTAKENFDKKKKQGKQKIKKSWKCFQCHKEGYLKKDCPEKKNNPKDSNNKNKDTATVKEEGYESIRVCVATDSGQIGK